MSVEKGGERAALQILVFALLVVVVSGFFRLVQIGFDRLDLTGNLFFVFALASITIGIVLVQRNAGYAVVFAAIALMLSLMVFSTCVLGIGILGLTC